MPLRALICAWLPPLVNSSPGHIFKGAGPGKAMPGAALSGRRTGWRRFTPWASGRGASSGFGNFARKGRAAAPKAARLAAPDRALARLEMFHAPSLLQQEQPVMAKALRMAAIKAFLADARVLLAELHRRGGRRSGAAGAG